MLRRPRRPRRPRRVAAATALVLVASVVALVGSEVPAGATTGWQPPVIRNTTDTLTFVGAADGSEWAFTQGWNPSYAWRPAGAADFGALQELVPGVSFASTVDAAAAVDGTVTAAFFDAAGQPATVTFGQDGSPGALQVADTATGRTYDPQMALAVGPGGAVALAYDAAGALFLSVRADTGTSYAPAALPVSSGFTTGTQGFPVSVGIDDAGDAIAAWEEESTVDGSIQRLRSAFRPAGGVIGAAEQLGTDEPAGYYSGGYHLVPPQIGMSASGVTTAAWFRDNASQGFSAVYVARRPAGASGTFSAEQALDYTSHEAREHLLVDRAGNATLVSQHNNADDPTPPSDKESSIVARTWPAAGSSFGAPVDLSTADIEGSTDLQPNGDLAAAVGIDGAVAVIWHVSDRASGATDSPIHGAVRAGGSAAFSPSMLISDPDTATTPNAFTVTVAGNGNAFALWDDSSWPVDSSITYTPRSADFISGLPPLAQRKATVTAAAASGIDTSSATVNGTVDGHGLLTQYRLHYGLTTAYGQTSAFSGVPGSGVIADRVAGLQPDTIYHVAIEAQNANGSVVGPDVSFRTAPAPGAAAAATPPPPAGYHVLSVDGPVFPAPASALNYWFGTQPRGALPLTGMTFTQGDTVSGGLACGYKINGRVAFCSASIDGPNGVGGLVPDLPARNVLPTTRPGTYTIDFVTYTEIACACDDGPTVADLSHQYGSYTVLPATSPTAQVAPTLAGLAGALGSGFRGGAIDGGVEISQGGIVLADVMADGRIIAAGSGNVIAAGSGNVIAAGSGNVIAAGAQNFAITNAGGIVLGVIAAGSGNFKLLSGSPSVIAAGSGNVIGAGAYNFGDGALHTIDLGAYSVIAAGSGSVIAAGSGNVIGAGAYNLQMPSTSQVIAAGSGNVIAAGSGNVIAAGALNRTTKAVGGLSLGPGASAKKIPAQIAAVTGAPGAAGTLQVSITLGRKVIGRAVTAYAAGHDTERTVVQLTAQGRKLLAKLAKTNRALLKRHHKPRSVLVQLQVTFHQIGGATAKGSRRIKLTPR